MASFPWVLVLCILPSAHATVVEEVDVAIIGAGYSGLAAAYELQKAGISFRVLEARDRVGGRTLNQNVGDTNTSDNAIELGGEWLAPQHTHAKTLFQHLGFSFFKRPYNLLGDASSPASPPCAGNCSIRVLTSKRGWQQVATQPEVFGLLSQEAQAAVKRAKSDLFRIAQEVPCAAPMSHPNASYYDSLSYDAYLRQVLHLDDEAYSWMSGYADDAEAETQVSTLAVLWTRNCSAGLVGSPVEDQLRVRGGTQGPAETLSLKMTEHIQLEARVSDIKSDGNGKHIISSTKGQLVSRHVLIAGLPPALVLGIHFQPALPGDVAQLLQRFPEGTSLKYSLVYKTPWWRKAGYLGKILVLNMTAASSRYTAECMDNSPYSWSRGVLMCFIEGDENRAFIKLSTLQRKSAMLSIIGEALGDGHEDELEEVVAHNWADDEFSRGAYSTFPMPGVLTSFWQPLSRIYSNNELGNPGMWIAGADYSSVGLGYIDGAIASGMQAARLIGSKLGSVLV